MIDLEREELMPLSRARLLFAGRRPGKRIDLSTVHRWCNRGVLHHGQRIRLESVRIGGVRHTSKQACMRFLARLADGRPDFSLPKGPSPASKAAGSELSQALAPRNKEARGLNMPRESEPQEPGLLIGPRPFLKFHFSLGEELGLKPATIKVFGAIRLILEVHRGGKTSGRIKYRDLMAITRVSKETLKQAVNALGAHGLLHFERFEGDAEYWFSLVLVAVEDQPTLPIPVERVRAKKVGPGAKKVGPAPK